MDLAQQVNILCLVREHFSKATDGDGQLVWEDVKGYGFDDARGAIIEHRREKGAQAWRPDPARIKSLAASRYNDRRRDAYRAARTIDFIRRQDRDGSLHDLSDERAILTHYRRCWDAVKDSGAGEIGTNGFRAYVLNGARHALWEIGIDNERADAGARWCVELAPGEKIPRKPLFRDLPKPLEQVKAFDALVALAKSPEPEPAPEPAVVPA